MIDCFDGKIVAWRTSRSPNKALTQGMLNDALATLAPLPPGAHRKAKRDLRVHTDRGGHYRGLEWIEAVGVAGITRSMSRKGNSGDNAACEGFFGRMKTEMFYGRKWENASQIECAIASYIEFYNNVRIKTSLGGMSIREYRERIELDSSKKASEAPFGR